MTTSITVVGGGLAGLVASVTAAEAGASVDLHEAHAVLGGRARSTPAPYVANFGPHALYTDGFLYEWLDRRGLVPPLARPALTGGVTLRWEGRVRKVPPALVVRGVRKLWGKEAPVDMSFREWVARLAGDDVAAAASGGSGVFSFTADPGALSAAFVAERLRRVVSVPPTARFPIGGWSSIVERLERRARELGVRIHLSSPVDSLPGERPVVVALEQAGARRLLGDEALSWPSGRCATLDVAIKARRRDPYIVSDWDGAGWVERYTAVDRSLAPAGESLLQAQVGLRDGDSLDDGVARIEVLLDQSYPGWRERETWRRRALLEGRSGALDLPGATWRDRPAVDRGDGVFLTGDWVAAPGLLAEVACASGVLAGQLAAGVEHPVLSR